MPILSDESLDKACRTLRMVDPYLLENVQPASIDLTLASDFKRIVVPTHATKYGVEVDLADVAGTTAALYKEVQIPHGYYYLRPREFVLGRTVETISIPDHMVGRVEGKSSLGRLGLLVHSTAGYVDPGFCGTITLEFYNLLPYPIFLRPGLRICQMSFVTLDQPAKRPYGSEGLGSKYQHQVETTESRYKG